MCRACAIRSARGPRSETRHASPPARCARPARIGIAIGGIAVLELRPQPMHDKAEIGAGAALVGRFGGAAGIAEARRPRQGQQIEIEIARRDHCRRCGGAAAARGVRRLLRRLAAFAPRHSGICRARKASSPAAPRRARERNCPRNSEPGSCGAKRQRRETGPRLFGCATASSQNPTAAPTESGGSRLSKHRHFARRAKARVNISSRIAFSPRLRSRNGRTAWHPGA